MGMEQVITHFQKDVFKTKCARDYIKYKQTKLPAESLKIIKLDLTWYSAFFDLRRNRGSGIKEVERCITQNKPKERL